MPAFTEGKYMSVLEKSKVLAHWEAFLKNGLRPTQFTEALYHHLMQHCSFIAHYDRGGFFSTYFQDPKDSLLFLSQFETGRSVEYGSRGWIEGWGATGDYVDINKAMIDTATKYLPKLKQELNEKIKTNLDTTIARLTAERASLR